jgi:hypothetical protein
LAVTQAAQVAPETGLDFPSNGQTGADVRFRFTGADLIPMYPATYVWRVNLRRHPGYYTTFFWGPDGAFTGASYYGAHPYPDGEPKNSSTNHKWELSIDGADIVEDANKNSTQLGYDTWRTQALRVFDDGKNKIHEFYWDLPDTSRIIRSVLPRGYGGTPPANPALTFGDAPWNLRNERLGGILRGIQLYAASLSLQDLLSELKSPLGTESGKAGIWYLNLDPKPDDISDKSGKAHHPQWVGAAKAAPWTGATSALGPPSDRPGSVFRNIPPPPQTGSVDARGRSADPDRNGNRAVLLPFP